MDLDRFRAEAHRIVDRMADYLEGIEGFFVVGIGITGTLAIVQPGVFGADAGIVEAGADRMAFENLAVFVLQ